MKTYRLFVTIETDQDLTPDQACEAVCTALAFGLESAGIPYGYVRVRFMPGPVKVVHDGETELV